MPEQTVTPASETLVTPAAAPAAAVTPEAGTPVDTKESAPTEKTSEETLLGKEVKKEEAKPESKAPEKYEFKAPEGFTLDTVLVEKISPVFKEIGLTQEQGQKLVDAYAPYVKQQIEAQQKELSAGYKKIVDGWKADTQKELGSDTPAKLAVAAKAINKFGTPALRELLNETGVGNHKELVNFFIKVGSAISEDSFVEPNKQTQGNSQEAFLKRNYPSMQT